tara:strand:+ start:5800 stop:7365 length:1566 start_codon:yes stop_codon:yes gene_type:complete
MAEQLNNKVQLSSSDTLFQAQAMGVYGFNETEKRMKIAHVTDSNALHVDIHGAESGVGDLKARTDIADPNTSTFIKCNSDGTLEMTAELSSAGLATEAKQDTIIARTETGNNTLSSIDNKIILPSVLNSDQLKVNDSAAIGSLATINNTLGDTNNKIDAVRGSSDLGAVNTSLGTINSTLGDTNNKIDAVRGTSDLGVINTSIGTTNSTLGDTNNKIDALRAEFTNGTAETRCMGNNSGSQVQIKVDANGVVETSGGGGGGGDATAANQVTGNTSLATIAGDTTSLDGKITACNTGAVVISSNSDTTKATSTLQTAGNTLLTSIDGKVATETTLAAAEVHLGNIDTQTSSIQSNVSTSANQSTMITHLSEIEGAVETVEACVSSNRLAVDTNNATHGSLAQLAVNTGATGANSAILDTAGYSKVVLVAKNSSNSSTAITASMLWSDSATFSGGTDFVMNSDDISGGAFAPVTFQSASSADSTFLGSQALFSITPPAQYLRINCFQSTGSTINVDFFHILSR